MEAVEVQNNTFLKAVPDRFDRSKAHRMESVEVQLHTFLNSAPGTV